MSSNPKTRFGFRVHRGVRDLALRKNCSSWGPDAAAIVRDFFQTRLLPLACKVPTPQISLRLTLLTGPTCPPAAPGLPLYTADTITTPCFKSLLAGDETRWSCGRFEGVRLLIVVI
ncbi:hypothetical protein ATANTOWER_030712 [Ataeniobius toweri]|uniref:Uncharacterized protein n=1 Tax=Ataeniobius toweri TaxID=208326 RepID=A0ABU7CGS5_9TELE|nr:hypothetical protein [Ataeniobius toweri]